MNIDSQIINLFTNKDTELSIKDISVKIGTSHSYGAVYAIVTKLIKHGKLANSGVIETGKRGRPTLLYKLNTTSFKPAPSNRDLLKENIRIAVSTSPMTIDQLCMVFNMKKASVYRIVCSMEGEGKIKLTRNGNHKGIGTPKLVVSV